MSHEVESVVIAWFGVRPEVARELGPSAAAAAFGRDPRGAVDYELRAARPAGILRCRPVDAPHALRCAAVGAAAFTELGGQFVVAMVIDRVSDTVGPRLRRRHGRRRATRVARPVRRVLAR